MPAPKKYYRNLAEIEGCEPDSLWILQGDKLVLVDDDQYIWVILDKNADNFYMVPDPLLNSKVKLYAKN